MAVQSLISLCIKVIMGSNIIQSACKMLSPTLLRYLLYQAILLEDTSWIQGLVRYWPLQRLSFDFDEFIHYTVVL